MSFSIQQIMFVLLALLTVVSSLGAVLLRNVVHAALMLGLSFASVGGLYALLGADFLFASQIMIYVGAIAVLFLFVVLLAGRREEISGFPFSGSALGAFFAGISVLALLVGICLRAKDFFIGHTGDNVFKPTTNAIGEAFLGRYAVGMEIVGVILLVALIGASLLAPARKEGEKS